MKLVDTNNKFGSPPLARQAARVSLIRSDGPYALRLIGVVVLLVWMMYRRPAIVGTTDVGVLVLGACGRPYIIERSMSFTWFWSCIVWLNPNGLAMPPGSTLRGSFGRSRRPEPGA